MTVVMPELLSRRGHCFRVKRWRFELISSWVGPARHRQVLITAELKIIQRARPGRARHGQTRMTHIPIEQWTTAHVATASQSGLIVIAGPATNAKAAVWPERADFLATYVTKSYVTKKLFSKTI